MGLVQDDQVPVFGLEQISGSVVTSHEVAGGEYERLLVPLLPIDPTFCRPLPSVDRLPEQLLAVVDRDVEVELLVELVLPLGQQRLGHEDQDSLGHSREPCLTDEQPGGDGLAQPHLVGNEHLAGPRVQKSLVCPHLVGPGRDRRSDLTHPGTVPGPGCVPDVGPDHATGFVGQQPMGKRFRRWFWLRIFDLRCVWAA